MAFAECDEPNDTHRGVRLRSYTPWKVLGQFVRVIDPVGP